MSSGRSSPSPSITTTPTQDSTSSRAITRPTAIAALMPEIAGEPNDLEAVEDRALDALPRLGCADGRRIVHENDAIANVVRAPNLAEIDQQALG